MSRIQSHKRARLAALAARPPLQQGDPKITIRGLRAQAVQEPVSGRSYIILRVETDAGVTGIGELAAGRDPAVALVRLLSLKPHIVGRDAAAYEAVQRPLSALPGVPPRERAAVLAALNLALLDILGKLSKAPLYEVLGGPTREKLRAFVPLEGNGLAALKASLDRGLAAGYRAFLAPVRLPEGPTRGRAFYRDTLRLLEDLRRAAGNGTDFILDGGGGLAPAEAASLAAAFEPFHLLWFDEPLADLNQSVIRKIAAESATPLGLGRSLIGNSGFQDLLREDAIDVLRPDISLSGVSQVRKAAALAETYYVAIAPFHRGGPIATAAALHAAASMPNFFIQEIPLPASEEDRAMRRELAGADNESASNGFLTLPQGPGLGVHVTDEALRKYAAAP
jgi:galactonate dehydratase